MNKDLGRDVQYVVAKLLRHKEGVDTDDRKCREFEVECEVKG